MPIDFSKLKSSRTPASLHPRDIFMSLPNKDRSYGYARDVQTEVWNQWFTTRNEKNTIIKMNTGSGKTVVGLTILQSCLNEGKGPAVYIVPDNYLVAQVCAEAQSLGIRVACDEYDAAGQRIKKGEEDYFFVNKKAILVANIFKLINGKSVFGLRQSGNVQIGSIVIDDVHACLDIIEQQYTVKIESEHSLYSPIIQRFGQYQDIRDSQNFYDITEGHNKQVSKLIPYWIWQDCCEDIRRMILSTQDDPIAIFNLPLLSANWITCNCVISSRCIEITPKSIPISQIASFESAQRRIFMSATLSDDSIFVSTMGLKPSDLSNIITPEKANDIGDRLILFPKHLSAALNDNVVKQKLGELAREYNVVIIVPSFDRLKFWEDITTQVPTQVLSSRDMNIESGISSLKQGSFKGLTILINKYDGIDLPDDACRFLAIDGLPAMRSEYDTIAEHVNPGDKRLCREHIQKIEQGIGRGVRSTNDYCVVVFMGNKLADVIINQDGTQFFSKATHEQYNISQQLWGQLMESGCEPTIDDVFALASYSLERNADWISTVKGAMASIKYDRTANIDSIVVAIRRAFEQENIGRYEEAFKIIEAEKNENANLDNSAKGVLMQLMAEYRSFSNPGQAQEILLSAQKLNARVLKPIAGIQYTKLLCFSDTQGVNAARFVRENGYGPNDYLIHIGFVLDSLIFSENSADSFEEALDRVAFVLGIHSSRPDKNGIKGSPDNLWAIGNLEYFVIECKNGVKADTKAISKTDCSQMLSSIQWFENLYAGNQFKCYPIIVHRVSTFDAAASPDPRMRVMTEQLLEKFKSAVKTFAKGMVHNLDNPQEIQKLLIQQRLVGQAIIDYYTVSPQ